MEQQVVPMFHVPDVRATVDWYTSIGFVVQTTNEDPDGDGLDFALLGYGGSQIMFTAGGQPSAADRREVDLYIRADDVDAMFSRLNGEVDIRLGPPTNTFYGTREFTVRDVNGFWVTFGQDVEAAVAGIP